MATKVGDTEWYHVLQATFPQELFIRIYHETVNEPRLQGLFLQIANYVSSLQQERGLEQVPALPVNSKKRKLEDGSHAAGAQHKEPVSGRIVNAITAFECNEVSVQIPARKKLKVSLTSDAHDSRRSEVQLLNPTTNELEHAIAADQIEDVFSMPVPDKQARQAYFAICPKADALGVHGGLAEHILFTMTETSPPSTVSASDITIADDDTAVSVTHRAFERLLAPHGKTIITPDAEEFASSRQQPHRKGEKAYHVNAHRGSKEGYLYFLPTGILFGFKKPLAFFPFTAIDSISYTSVLQRTFNLVITSHASPNHTQPSASQDVEFSMLDQEDFTGIDDYVKRHGLNDASMAAQRRAKIHNVNKEAKAQEDANGGAAAGGMEESELQKAEQQLQDEEDEEEEDYEASGGESDGEGEYSEEEEEEEVEGYDEEEEEEEEEGEGGEDDIEKGYPEDEG